MFTAHHQAQCYDQVFRKDVLPFIYLVSLAVKVTPSGTCADTSARHCGSEHISFRTSSACIALKALVTKVLGNVVYVFNGIWMTAEFAWQEESISLGRSCRNRHSWHLFSDRHRLQPSQTLHHHQFASNRNSPWSHGTCGHRLTCDEFSVGSCKNLLICLF